MMTHKKNLFRVLMICMMLLLTAALDCPAKLYIETDIATGIVTDVEGKVITLDSGIQYYPANEEINLEIKIGTPITLKFYTDAEQTNRYLEVAAGKNSLLKSSVPQEKRRGFK